MPSPKSSAPERPGTPTKRATAPAPVKPTVKSGSDKAANKAARPGTKASSPKKPHAPAQLGLDWNVPALTAGVDEAGRGPLAGPVVAAAVILDPLEFIDGLDDSKKLTARTRERLYDEIMAKALCCSIAQASVEEIEQLNILHATMLAMKRAVEGLRLKPGKVLVDGNRIPTLKVAAEAVIGGDATVAAIAAASILAKVHRDRLCVELHALHPHYGFDVHKGYSTPVHLAALRMHGASPVHRRGFAPVRAVLGELQMPAMPLPLPVADGDEISRDLIEAAFAASRAREDSPHESTLQPGAADVS